MTTKRNGLSPRVARGHEEAEGEGVELALAHDAEGGAFLAVDRDLQLHLALALAGAADQVDAVERRRCSGA